MEALIEDLASAPFWLAIAKIAWIDVLLSGDNAIVIALAARNLPPARQRQAVILGAAGAIVLRIVLIFFAVALLELPYVKLVGAVLLIWIGIQLMKGDEKEKKIDPAHDLLAAVRTILVADFVMSLDNVLAVAAIAETAPPSSRLLVLVIGLGLTVPLIMFGSTLLLKLIRRFPLIVTAGAALLGFVGGEMAATDPILDRIGLDQEWLPMALGLLFAAIVVIVGSLIARSARRAEPQPH
jgi:YjbE family integral membrane protein